MGAGWWVSELQSEHLGILLPSLLPDFCPVLLSGCHTQYSLNNSWANGTGKGPSSRLQRGPDQRVKYQYTHHGQELRAPRAPPCWRALPTPHLLLLPLRSLSILFLALPSWFPNAVHLVVWLPLCPFLSVLGFPYFPLGGSGPSHCGLPTLRTWIVAFDLLPLIPEQGPLKSRHSGVSLGLYILGA